MVSLSILCGWIKRVINAENHTLNFAVALVLFFFHIVPVHAGNTDEIDNIIDDTRNSKAVADEEGQWVGIPLVVSNPTVGTGLEPVLMYLHPKEASADHNSTTGLVGLYTNTRSWAAGIFHDGYLRNDTIRISGFFGKGAFKLKFYGIGDVTFPGGKSIPYEFSALVGTAKIQARIPKTEHWFAGLQYVFIDVNTALNTSALIAGLNNLTFKFKSSGLGAITTYDTRDDNYYPGNGQWFEGRWINYGKRWGGDLEYNKGNLFFNHYQPILKDVTLALRTRIETSSGGTPYFALSTLDMGGFSRDRYKASNTLSLHAEGRYKFNPRWGMVGFYELGWFNKSFDKIFTGRRITSLGGGLRWQITEKHKLHIAVDGAISSDDKAVYLGIGERF